MTAGITRNFTIPGLLAGADLSAKQYYWVKLASTAGEVVAVNGTTDKPVGILQNDPTDGQPAHVACMGVSKLVCGSTAVSAGALVGWNAEGQGNGRTADTEDYAGVAIEASSSDGDQIKVIFSVVQNISA